MNGLPPLPVDQRKIDDSHLRLLSIFHFIGAGLAILGIGFLLAHFMFMRMVLSMPQKNATPPPPEVLAMLKWMYLVFGVWFIVSGILNLLSGFFIRERKHWIFSMIVAGVNCLHMPLGTVLGVFTLIILSRHSVREVYGNI